MLKRILKNKGGFTLIELIIVIAILGILAAVLVPSIGNYVTKARKASAETDGATVYEAASSMVADYNSDEDEDNDITDSEALANALIALGYSVEAADDGPVPEDDNGITVHYIDDGSDIYIVVVWSKYSDDEEEFDIATYPIALHESMAASDD